MKRAACGSLKIQDAKSRQKWPSGHHRTTCRAISSQLRHVSTIGKKLLSSNMSPTCPHNMVDFGQLTAEIFWRVWCTIANFSGFRILASLVQQRRSTAVNQTLHDVWPSPGLVHYMYILWGFCPVTEFCHVQNSLCVQLLGSPLLAALLARHSSSGHHGKFAALYKEWNYGSFADGATCIQQGGHHVGHRPTF